MPPAPEGTAVDGPRACPEPGSVRPDELHNHGVSIGAGVGGGNGTSAVGPNARRGARSGVRQRGRSGRCCTFDRDPPPEDPRNHAETSRSSTLVKSSHVQSGSLCTWESIDARPVTRENRGIMRKTRDRSAGVPLSDVQYPAISGAPLITSVAAAPDRQHPRDQWCVPGAASTGGRGPRPGRRARAGGRDGGRGPVNREEWRSGRIVPPRTRRPLRRSRGIMRMPPGASGARRRTILPERQNRGRGRGRTDGD